MQQNGIGKCRLSRDVIQFGRQYSSSGSGDVGRGKGYEQAAALAMWWNHVYCDGPSKGSEVMYMHYIYHLVSKYVVEGQLEHSHHAKLDPSLYQTSPSQPQEGKVDPHSGI